MRWMPLGILALILTGCELFNAPTPVMVRSASVITIKIDPNLSTLGVATWSGAVCTITLRKYPICLQHEVRHCLEGNWHEGRESDEDCF